ncbi:hypothetical protein AMTRI_Chr03g145130 [Amborella trichopoda]|uniref:Uncharacterized protein n=1 Tax=Amborella trichopoda TaxID=13333 RepID=U5D5H8_AMBTC|nr:hypothetical protein AMTR_s00048p00153050 [Amborella trichopoda]
MTPTQQNTSISHHSLVGIFSHSKWELSISGSLIVWIQDGVDWEMGFGIPAISMAIAMVSFVYGAACSQSQRPHGSPLMLVSHGIMASLRKEKHKVFSDEIGIL